MLHTTTATCIHENWFLSQTLSDVINSISHVTILSGKFCHCIQKHHWKWFSHRLVTLNRPRTYFSLSIISIFSPYQHNFTVQSREQTSNNSPWINNKKKFPFVISIFRTSLGNVNMMKKKKKKQQTHPI